MRKPYQGIVMAGVDDSRNGSLKLPARLPAPANDDRAWAEVSPSSVSCEEELWLLGEGFFPAGQSWVDPSAVIDAANPFFDENSDES